MQLDYVESTKAFVLRVPRFEADPRTLMDEHGLNMSLADSTPDTAVLFTREPYAAVGFWAYASERARSRLAGLQTQIEASWAEDSQAHIDCPADQELSPYQKAGVTYSLARHNSLNGDEPGLGKTMQAICYANELRAKRVLVCCPANIRLQWCRRIRTWTTMRWPYTVYPILNGRHGVHPTAQWLVVSYDLVRTSPIWRAIAQLNFDLLVLDEAHYLKTIDAQRTRTVFGGGDAPVADALASRCAHVLALTGTPLPNRPREAYTLARGLCFDAIDWISEERFRERFNPSRTELSPTGKVYIKEDTGRHGELQSRLRANFMVRRLEADVLPQLKRPVLDIVHIEPDSAIKQALHAESLLDIDPEDLAGVDVEILGHVSVVRRMMGLALAPHAADYCDMLLQGGVDKLVCFAWHTEVLDILERKLARYRPLRIDGRTSPTQKQAKVDDFRNPDRRLMIGNILSLGTGTDGLQEVCQRGVAAEADWTPGNNEQAVKRLHRRGQEGQCMFDFLVAPGSFSEKVLGTSLRKLLTTHKALDRMMG